MIRSFGKVLFSNWRNKGIALFFAVSIWSLAFQSETREKAVVYRVKFAPLVPEERALVGLQMTDKQEPFLPAEGYLEVEVVLEGPRKQIDKVDEKRRPVVRIGVAREAVAHVFQESDFEYPVGGVTVREIRPSRIRIFQEAVKERVISNLVDRIDVTEYDRTRQTAIKEVIKPESGELKVRGPESIVDRVSVEVTVPMGYGRRPVDRYYPLRVIPADDPIVHQTVELWDHESQSWVLPQNPPRVRVAVRLEETEDRFSSDAVRVVFQLPLTQVACKVTLREVPPGTDRIPLAFEGPKAEIERLRELEQRSGITVSVPPPPSFDIETGGTFTFTEDSLRLDGFTGIRIRQHESRRRAFWSYEVKVVPEENGGG